MGYTQTEVLSCSILCFLSNSTIASKVQLQAKCWNLNHCSYNFGKVSFLLTLLMQPLCSTFVLGPPLLFVFSHVLTTRHKEMKLAAYLGLLGQLHQGERDRFRRCYWGVWGKVRETGPRLPQSKESHASPGELALDCGAFGRPKSLRFPRRQVPQR